MHVETISAARIALGDQRPRPDQDAADDLARASVEGDDGADDKTAVSKILSILASQPVSFALMCALSFAIPFCSLVFGIRH